MKILTQTSPSLFKLLGVKQTLQLYADAGFEGLDWNFGDELTNKQIRAGNYRGISCFDGDVRQVVAHYAPQFEMARAAGLAVTQGHAPFPPRLENDPTCLDFMIEVYKKNILACGQLGCKSLVIHGMHRTKGGVQESQRHVDELNLHLYRSLIPTLLQAQVTVCLENLFFRHAPLHGRGMIYQGHCSDPHEAIELIDLLNAEAGRECFGICVDIGHLHLVGADERKYLSLLGKRVKALHLHDNDGNDDDHLAPYNGSVIWAEVLQALAEIGYEGDLDFEIGKQINPKALPIELLPAQLASIAATGRYFCEQIQAKKA